MAVKIKPKFLIIALGLKITFSAIRKLMICPCGVLNLAGCHMPTQLISHFSLCRMGGEIRWKSLWSRLGNYLPVTFMGETDLTRSELSVGLWEKKVKTKNSFSQSPSPQTQLCSSFSSPLSHLHQPSVAQGDGEWGLLSVHSSSSSPLLPHTFTLLQCGAPSMGYSLSWGYPVWALLWLFQIYSTWLFSTGYRLFQCRFPMKCSSRKPTSAQDLPRLLHGLSTCCSLGTSLGAGGHVLQVDICSNVILHGREPACDTTAIGRGFSAPAPGEHLPLLLHHADRLQGCFFQFSLSPLPQQLHCGFSEMHP